MHDRNGPADTIGKLTGRKRQSARPKDLTAANWGDLPENSNGQRAGSSSSIGPSAPTASGANEREHFTAELNRRSRDIAQLTLLVGEAELASQEYAAVSDWLRKVAVLLLKQPRWWGVMPADWRTRRIRRRFLAHGLFDGDKYLRQYPDVEAERIDPLLHYLMHGMNEGRER